MTKIKVIISCDSNPLYSEFWNEVSYVWSTIFNIEPVLIYIADEPNHSLSEEYGTIIRKNIEKDIPLYLQGQLARIYYTNLYPDDICILSDADIIPLNRHFFNKEKILQKVDRETLYHLSPTKREFGQYPMCYYSGYGSTLSSMFAGLTWRQFLEDVIACDFTVENLGYVLPQHLQNNKYWFSDELYLYKKIKENNINININNTYIREEQRISREQLLNVDINNIAHYVDCHMPRPFSLYEKQINYLIFGIKDKDISHE